jgi:SsrA-binding protein
MAAAEKDVIKLITQNRKASHEFHIHERVEAGLVLVGSEVKSLRDGKATIVDGYAVIERGEGWLQGVQINEYPWANRWNHELKRKRKLLLHKAELVKLGTKTRERGFTLIPLSLYFKNGRVKVELGLCTHKKLHDKRQTKRAQDDQREIDRAIKRGS